VGYVTSGTYSPVLKKGIGMGYVKSKLNKSGVKLHVV
jgi:aminomethyltransferase